MKTVIFKRYCAELYGKGGFYTWVGYRSEEGNRIWGKDASRVLGNIGLDNSEKTDFYLECLKGRMESLFDEYFPSMFPSEEDDKNKNYIRSAFKRIQDKDFRFLPELNRYNKQDVISWWSTKENDLKIDEHLGNCLFCMEKPHGTVMLAIKDRPKEAKEFLDIVESEDVAKKDRKQSGEIMYRKETSFRWLYEKATNTPREEILSMSRLGSKLSQKNACSSGECSPLIDIHEDQLNLKL